MSDLLPNPFPPRKLPPVKDHSFAVLGWLYRSADAVGSARFAESLDRTRFYLDKAEAACATPGEEAVVEGLYDAVDNLIAANAQARVLLADSVSGMDAAEATEFIELAELAEEGQL